MELEIMENQRTMLDQIWVWYLGTVEKFVNSQRCLVRLTVFLVVYFSRRSRGSATRNAPLISTFSHLHRNFNLGRSIT